MRPDDLLKLRAAYDPRLHPSGSKVAFVVSGLDAGRNRPVHSIWLALLARDEPRALTALDGVAYSPRRSPDGSQLPFIGGDDGPPQLYVLRLGCGEARQLTMEPS